MHSTKTDRSAYMALGMLFGLAVGILMAPRSGEETRARLREQAMAVSKKAGDKLSQKRQAAMQTVGDALEKSQDMIQNASGKAEDMAQKTANRTRTAANDMSEQAQQSGRRRNSSNG